MNSPTNIIQVENLCFGLWHKKQYLKLLKNINFSLTRGQTLGVVGESGSGKTTLGRAIVRLYEPTEGKVIFDDKDITHMSENELRPIRKDIQFIFQDPLSSLNPRKRVWQLIGDGMLLHNIVKNENEAKEVVADLLKQVSLDSTFMDRFPHQLSGGQRQRIGIARAIALKPKLIIADEVVSGLDVSSQAKVLDILNDLRKKYDLCLIFISHDLSVVRLLCNQLLVLYHGDVVEQGDSNEIFTNPAHQYTKTLLSAIPHIDTNSNWLS